MTRHRIREFLGAGLLAAGMAMLSGCASLHSPASEKILADDVTPEREARRAEAVGQLDRRRDLAQYEAALARATEGDLDDCETLLRSLLARNPQHREARLLLSEALLARNRTTEAEEQLGLCLMQRPDDAQAHFQLAALLETTGREALAREHFQQAAAANPDLERFVGRPSLDQKLRGARPVGDNRQGRN